MWTCSHLQTCFRRAKYFQPLCFLSDFPDFGASLSASTGSKTVCCRQWHVTRRHLDVAVAHALVLGLGRVARLLQRLDLVRQRLRLARLAVVRPIRLQLQPTGDMSDAGLGDPLFAVTFDMFDMLAGHIPV